MNSNKNQVVGGIDYLGVFLLRILLVILLPLFLISAKASEHQNFWYWLDSVKNDLERAGEFSYENEYRVLGYFNAVSTRLKTLHPNLDGAFVEYEKDQYTLYLYSGGVAEAIEEIEALENTQPKDTRLKIETIIEPGTMKILKSF